MQGPGLRPFLPTAQQAPIIATLHAPQHSAYDFKRIHATAKARGFMIYPDKLTAAETVRIGCIGAIGLPEMQQAVNAAGEALRDIGIPARPALPG